MYLCYVDESRTPEIPGTTSHFVLAGLAIPIWHWRNCDNQISHIKKNYGLENYEIHIAWMLRRYAEQEQIPDFDKMDYRQRLYEVQRIRKARIFRLQRAGDSKKFKQTKKTYKETEGYIHLTLRERESFITEIAQCI